MCADNHPMSYENPTHEELVREALLRMMSDLSEDCWCAGWMTDLEFTLWTAVETGNKDFGFGMRECDLSRLKHLHEMAGGWWVWEKGEADNRFVTTEEWLTILAERGKQAPNTEDDGQPDTDSPR
jgi:hypothetical protein